MKSECAHQISSDHLARQAVVYVRQSSPGQVLKNVESTRLQKDLRHKAMALGWRQPVVIDEDLGISAGGYAERPGFQGLLTRVATRQVGIIFCIEASRLSRNSKDWAQLFELCSLFDTLIADVDQVYDLSNPNDRLVMGIKGTVSEMELGLIRQRMRAGVEAKAARGELRYMLPIGYAYDTDDQVVFDPDERVRHALRTMFRQFDRCSSARQLAIWYRDSETRFPLKSRYKNGPVRWEYPSAGILSKLLRHPFHAGAYVYGRTQTGVEYVDSEVKKCVTRSGQPRVCIRDHHPAYINWERHLENCAKISKNRPMWRMQENQGAIREGLALLVGLLRCAKCGKRMRVGYPTKKSAIYYCDGEGEVGSRRCMSFTSSVIDVRVGEELCRALEPHSLQAGIRAAQMNDSQRVQELESARLQVEAAQYQVDRSLEQFDQCDPKNRHVAGTLEERLNDKLVELQAARDRYGRIENSEVALSEEARARLQKLSRNFPIVWGHPKADPKLKKRLLRAAINEILVKPQEEPRQLELTIHWQGGVHSRIYVPRRPARRERSESQDSFEPLIKKLAEQLPDAEIARILNLKKQPTPGGLQWTQNRVRAYRKQRHIHGSKREANDDSMTMRQVQRYLDIGTSGVKALARRGLITTNQITNFAPWKVAREELDSGEVQELVKALKRTGRLPKGGSSKAQPGLFDAKQGVTTEVNQEAL